jgi:WS/DGAT/MGAT family acyltransferase
MTTQPISKSDLTWLNMDEPTNLMVVNGLMWFHGEPDWQVVREIVQERLVERYSVMTSRARKVGGDWVWEPDPDFDLDRHIRHTTLPEPGDRAAAQDYVSGRISRALDRKHPLWEFDFITGFVNENGEPGSLILARFHHVLADGIRIVQLILGMCDVEGDVAPPAVGRKGGPGNPVKMAAGAAKGVAGNAASFAKDTAAAALRAVPQIPGKVTSLRRDSFYKGYEWAVKPTQVTDAVSALSSQDNTALNSWRSASRLALWGHESRLVADQAPGVDKRVGWVAGMNLDQVKAVGAAHNATVNDVLLAAVSLGVTEYLHQRGREVPSDTNFMIPISLKPIDMSLPKELGNHFAVVMFPMPLGLVNVDALLIEIRERMARIKNSAEAMMVFGIQRAVAETPQTIGKNLTRLVANKSVGILTNVPGPRAPIFLAGHEVAGVLGWVPTSSDQSIGLCIFSYNGEVNIGIATDAGIIPDPDHLGECIKAGFAEMIATTP